MKKTKSEIKLERLRGAKEQARCHRFKGSAGVGATIGQDKRVRQQLETKLKREGEKLMRSGASPLQRAEGELRILLRNYNPSKDARIQHLISEVQKYGYLGASSKYRIALRDAQRDYAQRGFSR